ncbi:MAG: IS1 family transposase, partial [Spirochaetaceae bacterium]|nr:IS1 family transposase [Spirochaetaceae bacterium]
MKNQNKGAIVLELDEMWHYIEKKSKLWIWKAFCRDTGELVDWECGARDAKTLKVMLDRLKALDVSVFFTDHWECY